MLFFLKMIIYGKLLELGKFYLREIVLHGLLQLCLFVHETFSCTHVRCMRIKEVLCSSRNGGMQVQ